MSFGRSYSRPTTTKSTLPDRSYNKTRLNYGYNLDSNNYNERIRESSHSNDKLDLVYNMLKSMEQRIASIEDLFNTKLKRMEKRLEETNINMNEIILYQDRFSNTILEKFTINDLKHEQCIKEIKSLREVLTSQFSGSNSTQYNSNIRKLSLNTDSSAMISSEVRHLDNNVDQVINTSALPGREPMYRSHSKTSYVAENNFSDRHKTESKTPKEHISNKNSLLPSKMSGPIQAYRQTTDFPRSPRGLDNPAGYCYLNCVIQLLRGCREFNDDIVEYHSSSAIAQSNNDADINERRFVNDFCKLIDEMNCRKDVKVKETVMKIHEYFSDASQGDDIMQCFMKVLTKIHNIVNKKRTLQRTGSLTGMTANVAFDTYKLTNQGFVFNSFYGQMSNKLFCKTCMKDMRESFQLFKTMGLPVPKQKRSVKLVECVKMFLEESPVESTTSGNKLNGKNCLCNPRDVKIFSKIVISHAPKYLFLYLNRGSYYVNGAKNNTFVDCEETLSLPVLSGTLEYELISVVDHVGDNEDGHYFVKSCFETIRWYTINDGFVTKMTESSPVVTKNTIVFLFKRIG